MALWRFEYFFFISNFQCNFSNYDSWGNTGEIALKLMSMVFTYDKSTVALVMALYHKQKVTVWANLDPVLHCHMVSLGHSRWMDKLWHALE